MFFQVSCCILQIHHTLVIDQKSNAIVEEISVESFFPFLKVRSAYSSFSSFSNLKFLLEILKLISLGSRVKVDQAKKTITMMGLPEDQ